jgi:hypothetical protein
MRPEIGDIIRNIRSLEEELEVQLALARAEIHVRIEGGKVEFEEAVRRRHAAMKVGLARYVLGAKPLIALTAPLIYALIVPLVLLDAFVTIYQLACFPVYGIARVRRRDYLIFDRRYLAYLNALEKLNCAYCSYANGLIGYVREIAARTEQYWCPIKHARRIAAAHPHYADFVDFGDADGYRADLEHLRAGLRKDRGEGPRDVRDAR